jgi:hypothetical protein
VHASNYLGNGSDKTTSSTANQGRTASASPPDVGGLAVCPAPTPMQGHIIIIIIIIIIITAEDYTADKAIGPGEL